MEASAASSSSSDVLVVEPRPRRRDYRQKVQNLAYVRLDQANGGIIRDLSESGIAIQAVAPLRVNQEVSLRFELLNPRARVEARGRVAWADPQGQAGMEFLDITERSRHMLKDWIFTQLMATAQHAERADSIFIHNQAGESTRELLFSDGAREAIPVEPTDEVDEEEEPQASVPVFGSPLRISARGISRMVDSLVLLCAVLLFAIISLGMTNLFPTWPLAIALALGITSMFAAVYWYLFAVCVGMTPGEHLARVAYGNSTDEDDDLPRFR